MNSSYITTLPFRGVFRECLVFDLGRRKTFAAITLKFLENKENSKKQEHTVVCTFHSCRVCQSLVLLHARNSNNLKSKHNFTLNRRNIHSLFRLTILPVCENTSNAEASSLLRGQAALGCSSTSGSEYDTRMLIQGQTEVRRAKGQAKPQTESVQKITPPQEARSRGGTEGSHRRWRIRRRRWLRRPPRGRRT